MTHFHYKLLTSKVGGFETDLAESDQTYPVADANYIELKS